MPQQDFVGLLCVTSHPLLSKGSVVLTLSNVLHVHSQLPHPKAGLHHEMECSLLKGVYAIYIGMYKNQELMLVFCGNNQALTAAYCTNPSKLEIL